MTARLMLLPAKKIEAMKIVRIPDDFDKRDAVKHATSLIGSIEEESSDYEWEDIAALLEDHGFEILDFLIGPDLG